MLNAVTIAAIVAACWAHPSGVAYLAKIEQIQACAEAKGNPCCQLNHYGGKRRDDLSVERVLESWEWLDAQRARQAQDRKYRIAPVDEVEFTAGSASPSVQDEPPGIIAMPLTKIHDAESADKAALADRQRRNRRAMLMLLAMAEDED